MISTRISTVIIFIIIIIIIINNNLLLLPPVQCDDWTFQDGFCSHADEFDVRLNIHSFMISHGKLYIVVALTFFVVDLGRPPFNVTSGNFFVSLSNQLTQNVQRNYRATAYTYASFALEISPQWEVLMMSFSVMDVTQDDYRYHTQNILRKMTRDGYQPPLGTCPIMFNAYFSNLANISGITRCHYNVDRFISSGDGYMIQTQQRPIDGNSKINYIFLYEIKPGLDISSEVIKLIPLTTLICIPLIIYIISSLNNN